MIIEFMYFIALALSVLLILANLVNELFKSE